MRIIEVDDVETANAMLRAQYTSMRLAALDTGRTLRIEQRDLGSVGLHHVAFGMSADAVGEPLGAAWIGRIDSGSVTYRHDNTDVTYGVGDVVLAAQPDTAWQASLHYLRADWALIEPASLSDFAAPRHADQPIAFTQFTPTSPVAAARWCLTYDYARSVVAGLDDSPEHELVAASAAQLLVTTALATIPNDAVHEPAPLDRRDAHTETLRRAVAFVEANPHRPITTADIARATHVTIRSVQFAFRRQLDTTPMAYLRKVRLDGARSELRQGSPSTTTVAAVSARWGFLSASQFAARYKAMHGESPSITLHR